LNYCGIATLSFLGLLQNPVETAEGMAGKANVDISSCTRWMLDRQTTWIEEDEYQDEDEDEEDENEDEDPNRTETQPPEVQSDAFGMSKLHEGLESEASIAGFCGRCGKIADTCYCFWNVGALAVSASE
jgi:geranylgeranyl transferase type-1 subunit beta